MIWTAYILLRDEVFVLNIHRKMFFRVRETILDTHKPKPDLNSTDGNSLVKGEVLLLSIHWKWLFRTRGDGLLIL